MAIGANLFIINVKNICDILFNSNIPFFTTEFSSFIVFKTNPTEIPKNTATKTFPLFDNPAIIFCGIAFIIINNGFDDVAPPAPETLFIATENKLAL